MKGVDKNKKIQVPGEGSVLIKTPVNGESRVTELYPVVYYLEATNRLLSIDKL